MPRRCDNAANGDFVVGSRLESGCCGVNGLVVWNNGEFVLQIDRVLGPNELREKCLGSW